MYIYPSDYSTSWLLYITYRVKFSITVIIYDDDVPIHKRRVPGCRLEVKGSSNESENRNEQANGLSPLVVLQIQFANSK